MELSYDLHIHSALSPCGDNDMTPNNIAGMAYLKQLDMIAVTDHNSVKNLESVQKAANEYGILLIPGMELSTAEDIHVLCYFETIAQAQAFGEIVEKSMQKIKNRVDIFGHQYVMDENDSIKYEVEHLLTMSSGLSLQKAAATVNDLGGVCVPAHVDKSSYSTISVLGYIPEECNFKTIEISKKDTARAFAEKNSFEKYYNILQSSDAHYLGDISEKTNFINIYEKSTKSFLNFVKHF